MTDLQIRLKELRKQNNLTQKFICEKINIPRRTYNSYEQGLCEPGIEVLKKIADLYEISLDFLTDHQLYNKPAGEFYQLTDKQKELIPYIKNLDDGTCMRVLGYLDKISQEQEELIRKFN